MQVIRIFLKPSGQAFFDAPIPEGCNLMSIMQTWKMEGVLIQNDCWAVHWDGWVAVAQLTMPDSVKPSVVPFKPNVIPATPFKFGPSEPPDHPA